MATMKLVFWLSMASGVLVHLMADRDGTAMLIAYGFYAVSAATLTEAVWRFLEKNASA